jgi:hypothetical protein
MTPVQGETLFVDPFDEYELVGLPDGTWADITLVLDYQGWIAGPECLGLDCGATFIAMVFDQFFDARAVVRAATSGGQTSERDSLMLATRMQVGRPYRAAYRLEVRVGALGQHEASWTGRLRFSGLPDGARIVSCHGYGDGGTPIRASTWGQVKAAYR